MGLVDRRVHKATTPWLSHGEVIRATAHAFHRQHWLNVAGATCAAGWFLGMVAALTLANHTLIALLVALGIAAQLTDNVLSFRTVRFLVLTNERVLIFGARGLLEPVPVGSPVSAPRHRVRANLQHDGAFSSTLRVELGDREHTFAVSTPCRPQVGRFLQSLRQLDPFGT